MNYNNYYHQYGKSNPQLQEVVITDRDTKRNKLPEKTGTSVWGPHLWFVMHFSALYYPQNPTFFERKHMKNFILSLPILIPCNVCKQDTIKYIEQNLEDIDRIVTSRDLLFQFFVQFHNYVNQKTNPKKPTMSVDEAYDLYLNNPSNFNI